MIDMKLESSQPTLIRRISSAPNEVASENALNQLQDKKFTPFYLSKQRNQKALIKLKKKFLSEFILENLARKEYMDSKEREQYRVIIKEDGSFCNTRGELLSGKMLYVMIPDNDLYAIACPTNIHHSSVSAGEDVEAAGMAFFCNGRPVLINNDSGHYKPTKQEMIDAFIWFSEKSKNEALIFEDHSAQNSLARFNGIQYYSLVSKDIHPIPIEELVDAVFASYDNTVSKYNESLSKVQESSNTESGISNSEGYQIISEIEMSPYTAPADILDNLIIQQYTSLGALLVNPQHLSRFNGLPDPRRRMTV